MSPFVGEQTGSPRRRPTAVQFLVMLLLLLVVAPLVKEVDGNGVISTLVFFTGAIAMGGSGRRLALIAVMAALAAVCLWGDHLRQTTGWRVAACLTSILYFACIVGQLLHFVTRSKRVNAEVLCAAFAGYLTLGIGWGLAYSMIYALHPGAFHFNVPPTAGPGISSFDLMYFSFVTLTTVGYGDVFPVANVARMLAMLEAITGTAYLAVLISRLVSLYSSDRRAG